jgi:hypothetical protein
MVSLCRVACALQVASLHRCAWRVASVCVACCIGARCIAASATRSPFAAPCCVMRCTVCCACAARLGRGRALRSPSGGAMHSCAALWWRRALHGQRHRALRRRGDIRHRCRGACGAGRQCESGRMRTWGGCRFRRGAGPIAIVMAASAVQDGGVVWMSDGAVTFKGGNISNTTAVRAHMLRWHVPLRLLQR